MASLDALVARDMAFIVGDADAPLSREVIFWDSTVTSLTLDEEDAIATVNANVFYKLENRQTDHRGKAQVKMAILNFLAGAIAIDEAGWFVIDGDTDHTYKIESANKANLSWTVRGKQQKRTNRSAGNRTHGI